MACTVSATVCCLVLGLYAGELLQRAVGLIIELGMGGRPNS
jgi:hypothetical protein